MNLFFLLKGHDKLSAHRHVLSYCHDPLEKYQQLGATATEAKRLNNISTTLDAYKTALDQGDRLKEEGAYIVSNRHQGQG